LEILVEPPGKCFWCGLNSGQGVPAYRAVRGMDDFKREADICKKCFDAFDGLHLESLMVIHIYG
jgi:hypothetical protein